MVNINLLLLSQYMIILSSRLLKNIFELKIEACPVNVGLCMAFKLSSSFATILAANSVCIALQSIHNNDE